MSYIVVEAFNPEDLESAVRKQMEDGWRPQGGVSVLRWDYTVDGEYRVEFQYSQAMVQETE